MSRSCWEAGTLKFSVKEYGAFRRGMIQWYNERQGRIHASAVSVYTRIKAEGKGKRNFDYDEAFRKAADLSYGSMYSRPIDGDDEIYNVLFPSEKVEGKGWQRSKKPHAPKKKDFPTLKLTAESISVDDGEASIRFDNKTRTVRWGVSENNHAVERAREHAIGREFFSRLSRVNWTRGTGGQIIGKKASGFRRTLGAF
jgi:hypothetical protein